METVDEEFLTATLDFIDRANQEKKPFFAWFNPSRMQHDRHLHDRQRRRDVHLARWRYNPVPQREAHQLGGRLSRAGGSALARLGAAAWLHPDLQAMRLLFHEHRLVLVVTQPSEVAVVSPVPSAETMPLISVYWSRCAHQSCSTCVPTRSSGRNKRPAITTDGSSSTCSRWSPGTGDCRTASAIFPRVPAAAEAG
jgi:hypothetical protein